MIQVVYDGSNETDSVLSYSRNQQICTGIGKLNIQFSKSLGQNPQPWDKIVLYEQGEKKGTYYVETHTYIAHEGMWDIEAVDSSKKIQDYFVFRTWSLSYTSTARYWITKILKEAKVKYSFSTSSTGAPVGINTSIGLDTAYNIIQQLLQQSGWYIYFTANGKAIIGDLNRNIENYQHSINDSDIINIEINKDDRRLRNRAVVWGNADPMFGGQIFKDISVQTPWNYDSRDKRAVVLSNSMIRDDATATELARGLLDEFAHILHTKNIRIGTENSIELGDSVLVNSKYFNGIGLVTTMNSEFSGQGGLVTNVILSEKCPRLFAYFNYWEFPGVPIWVYVGTTKDGVWRRLSDSDTWEDNSSGFVDDLHIKDMHIKNGVFSAITKQGSLYTRTVSSNYWNKYEHPDLTDQRGETYPATAISGVACSVNDLGYVVAGYNYISSGVSTSGNRAWVLEMTPYHYLLKAEQVVVGSNMGQRIHDLEAQPEYNIVSTSGNIGSGMNENFWVTFGGATGEIDGLEYSKGADEGPFGPWGGESTICGVAWAGQEHPPTNATPDKKHYFVGPADTGGEFVSAPLGGGVNYSYHYNPKVAGPIIDEDDRAWQVGGSYEAGKGRLCWVSLIEPGDFGYYEFDLPLEVSGFWYPRWGHINKSSDTLFEWIVMRVASWDYESNTNIEFYHLSYVLGAGSANLVYSTTIEQPIDGYNMHYGTYAKGANFACAWEECITGQNYRTLKYFSYNLDAQGGNVRTLATLNRDKSLLSIDTHTMPDIVGYGEGGCIIMYYTKETLYTWEYSFPFFPPSTRYGTNHAELYAHVIQVTDSGVLARPNRQISGVTWNSRDGGEPGSDYGSLSFDPLTTSVVTAADRDNGYSVLRMIVRHWDIGHDRYLYSIEWPFGRKSSQPLSDSNDNPDLNSGPHDFPFDKYLRWYQLTSRHPDALSFNSKNYEPIWITYGVPKEVPQEDDNIIVNHINARTLRPVSTWDFTEVTGGYGGPWTTFNMDDANNTMYYYTDGAIMFGIGPGGRFRNKVRTNKRESWGTWMTTHHGFLNSSNTGLYFRFAGDSWQYIYEGVPAQVLKHTSIEDTETIQATDAALETKGEYEVIYNPGKPVKVEISKYSPTVVYSVASGEMEDQYSLIAASIMNTPDSFYTPTEASDMKVYDSRVIDISNTAGYVIASGDIGDLDFERYVMVGSEGGIYLIPYQMEGQWSLLNTTPSGIMISSGISQSGIFNAIEATNYTYPNPFIFYSISGAQTFYQRNPDSAYFVDYSAGLPSSDITIIRTDDEI